MTVLRWVCGILLLVLSVVFGCGPGSATVTGKVTYKGKPVVSGTVVMLGSDERMVSAEIKADGQYVLAGVRSGKVRIGVSSPPPAQDGHGGGRRGGDKSSGGAPPPAPK